jgi:hypothetical protein
MSCESLVDVGSKEFTLERNSVWKGLTDYIKLCPTMIAKHVWKDE